MWNRTMRGASYLTSLNRLNRRRGSIEHRERRWSLRSITRWTLLRLPQQSYTLPQIQRRSSPTFLVMPYWPVTALPRIEEKVWSWKVPQLRSTNPLHGWVDVHWQLWGGRHRDSFASNWCHWWLHSERHRCVVAWHWRTDLAGGPCDSWTTWCIHQAQCPHWKSRQVSIDQHSWACVIWREKCQGLIGFHNFTGANWGGFVGISKKSWITSYLSLSSGDPVVSAFQLLGEGKLTSHDLEDGELPEEVRPMEKLVWSVYRSGGATSTPALHWELFRSRNLDGEKLPPTKATPISYAGRGTKPIHLIFIWVCN